MIAPDLAHTFADVMDEILRSPAEARALAGTPKALLQSCAADASFTGRLDVAMRTVLQDLAAADTSPGTDLTAAVNAYKTTYGDPTWTHVAGASFTPQRQRITTTTDPLFEDEDAEAEFKDGTDLGLSDLDALIRFATIEIDKANGKHQDELAAAHLTAPERAATVMVFLGPEWMFANRLTPVSPQERDSTIEKFRKLSVLYPQMVLVPGTIRSGKPRTARKHKKHWKDIRNTVFVVWNGQVVHTHDKLSDVGDTTISPKPGDNPIKRYGGDGTEMAKDPIFELGNLKFAIDICGDHFNQRAKNANGTGTAADVHLVTAAGTTPDRDKSADLANMDKGTKPTVASSTTGGRVVDAPVQSVGNQILTGHAADKGQKKF